MENVCGGGVDFGLTLRILRSGHTNIGRKNTYRYDGNSVLELTASKRRA
jgi:hypothetical protein